MRSTSLLALAWLLAGAYGAAAGECAVSGPPVTLEAEVVDWTLTIASGGSCVRGLRSRAMTLDSVRLASPAHDGAADVQGYGFTYRARPDFTGEDFFTVAMSGISRGVRGATTIRVRVLVR